MGEETKGLRLDPDAPKIGDENYRWLHDKFERLKAHEDDLLLRRLEAFYVIQGALVTAAVAIFATTPFYKFQDAFAGISFIGIIVSLFGWAGVAKASVSVQYWHEVLELLEQSVGSTSLKGLPAELAVPFTAHAKHVHRHPKGKGLNERFNQMIFTPNKAAWALTYYSAFVWFGAGALAGWWPLQWSWIPHVHI